MTDKATVLEVHPSALDPDMASKPKPESRDRTVFRETANRRVKAALEAIQLVGRLGRMNTADAMTEQDIQNIEIAFKGEINKMVKELTAALKGEPHPDVNFDLG